MKKLKNSKGFKLLWNYRNPSNYCSTCHHSNQFWIFVNVNLDPEKNFCFASFAWIWKNGGEMWTNIGYKCRKIVLKIVSVLIWSRNRFWTFKNLSTEACYIFILNITFKLLWLIFLNSKWFQLRTCYMENSVTSIKQQSLAESSCE